MKITTHTILQILGFIISGGTMLAGIVPPKAQPYVVLVVSAAQGFLAWYNHSFNTDGTPQSVAFAAKLILLCLLLAGSASAQTPAPAPTVTMFAVGQQAMGLHLGGATNPGSDSYGQYAFTSRVILRTDTLLVPGNNFQGYYGGVGAHGSPDALFGKTNLPKNTFEAYGFVEGGIVRNVPAIGTAIQKPSIWVHGGLNYDPTGSGKFTVNIIDGGYLNAASFGPKPNGYTLSVGIKLGLWTKP